MKLTARLKSLMINDASITGTYNVTKGALGFIIEQLTSPEYEALKKFYGWLVEKNKTWGYGNLDAVWKEYTLSLKIKPMEKVLRDKPMNNYVKEYQCLGCTSGGIGCFSKSEADLSCKKHSPGTVLLGTGTIMLGMPKGFNRLGPAENANISIFETYEDFMKKYANIKTKYCVPVWRYVNKDKHTFLRIYNPRTNVAEITIILEDCSKEFTCIEITQEDIAFMD